MGTMGAVGRFETVGEAAKNGISLPSRDLESPSGCYSTVNTSSGFEDEPCTGTQSRFANTFKCASQILHHVKSSLFVAVTLWRPKEPPAPLHSVIPSCSKSKDASASQL